MIDHILKSDKSINEYEELARLLKYPVSKESLNYIDKIYSSKSSYKFKTTGLALFNSKDSFMRGLNKYNVDLVDGKYSLMIDKSWFDPKFIREELLNKLYPEKYNNDRPKDIASLILMLSVLSEDRDLINITIPRCMNEKLINDPRIDLRFRLFKYGDDIFETKTGILNLIVMKLALLIEIYNCDQNITKNPSVQLDTVRKAMLLRKNIIRTFINTDKKLIQNIFDENLISLYDSIKNLVITMDRSLEKYKHEIPGYVNTSLASRTHLEMPWVQPLNEKIISDNINSKFKTTNCMSHYYFMDYLNIEVFPILYNDLESGLNFFMRTLISIANYKNHHRDDATLNKDKRDSITAIYKDIEIALEILGEDSSILVEKISDPECSVLYQYLL